MQPRLFQVKAIKSYISKAVEMQTLCWIDSPEWNDCHSGEIEPTLKSVQSCYSIHMVLHIRNVTVQNVLYVPWY